MIAETQERNKKNQARGYGESRDFLHRFTGTENLFKLKTVECYKTVSPQSTKNNPPKRIIRNPYPSSVLGLQCF